MEEDKMMQGGRTMEGLSMAARWASLVVVVLAASWLAFGSAAGQASRPGTAAPDVSGGRWINSAPLTTQSLRGRVVLVEFWTFG